MNVGIYSYERAVARLDSVERAKEARRYIQYDPEPPI